MMDEDNSIQDETPKKGTRASEPVSPPEVRQEPAFSEATSDAGSPNKGVAAKKPAEVKKRMTAGRKQPERDQTEANLTWPPTKEDLERLYVKEHLSAMKIAKLYGLKYPNPKSSEAMILYHLKHKGITRRDSAEHNRKATKEMVDVWIERYQAGESLKQIAGEDVDVVTVFHHLHKGGLKLRDKVEAQIEAVTKHERKPFSGDSSEMAYLLGFARGDMWITTHGRAVRARAGSTHPAFIQLFEQLYGRYGHIYLYPKEDKLTGYEWSMDVDLDKSFMFLLERDEESFRKIMADETLFYRYLAGFFDAEGSIHYHRKGSGGAFELAVTNMDIELLNVLCERLVDSQYSAKLGRSPHNNGTGLVSGADHIWRIQLWRYDDVSRLLKMLPLQHPEKVAKREIALTLPTWPPPDVRSAVLNKWNSLLDKIDSDVAESIRKAQDAMKKDSQTDLSLH
jgi:hypothetical protein